MRSTTSILIYLAVFVVKIFANHDYPPVSYSGEPLNYLQPPAPPVPFSNTNNNNNNGFRNTPHPISHPHPPLPPPPPIVPSYQPTFMQKIASWFGFGGGPTVDTNQIQQSASSQISQYRQAPRRHYNNPTESSAIQKSTCNPCNQVPWIPMFQNGQQYPVMKDGKLIQNSYNRAPQNQHHNQNHPHSVGRPQQQQPDFYPTKPLKLVQSDKYRGSVTSSEYLLPPQNLPIESERYKQNNNIHHQQEQTFQQQQQYQQQLHQQQSHQQQSHEQQSHQQQLHQHQHQKQPQYQQQQHQQHLQHQQHQQHQQYHQHQQQQQQQQQQHHLSPIPLPNLSATPIPPLHDSQNFLFNPYGSDVLNNQNTQNFNYNKQNSNLLEPVPQLSNNVQIHKVLISEQQQQQQQPPQQFSPSQQEQFSSQQQQQQQYPQQLSQLQQQLPQNIYNELKLSSDTDIEIIKSIPIAQFSTAVKYPINNFYEQNLDGIKHDIDSLNKYITKPIIVNTDDIKFITTTIPTTIINDNNDNYSSGSLKLNITLTDENHTENYPLDNIEITEKIITSQTDIVTPTSSNGHQNYRALNTDNNDSVVIEASIQTDLDNNKIRNNLENYNVKVRERKTPKNLLDSPIHYFKGTTSLNPNENLDENQSQLIQSDNNYGTWIQSSPLPSSTTTTPNEVTPSPISYTFNRGSSGDFKKPKQIQIIIPYTNNKSPSPFRLNNNDDKQYSSNIKFDKNSGWSAQTHDFEFHDQQESKLVTATESAESLKKTTKYLTKILASNLRDLLRKEKYYDTKTVTPTTTDNSIFDQTKLQMSIDGWTEQEFAVSDLNTFSNKASTISFLAPSRNFPREYLTTTPLIPTFPTPTTTTIVPTTTTTTTIKNHPTEEPQIYFDSKKIIDNYNSINNLLTEKQQTINTNKNPQIILSSPSPFSSDLWKNLGVTISPITKEKVYVVTPQSLWNDFKQISADSIGFKSPRFIIRPSPAERNSFKTVYDIQSTLPYSINNLQTTTTTTTTTKKPLIVPKLFGFMNTFDSYLSQQTNDDDEITDEHSKIITIITPATLINKKKVTEFDEKNYFKNNNL